MSLLLFSFYLTHFKTMLNKWKYQVQKFLVKNSIRFYITYKVYHSN